MWPDVAERLQALFCGVSRPPVQSPEQFSRTVGRAIRALDITSTTYSQAALYALYALASASPGREIIIGGAFEFVPAIPFAAASAEARCGPVRAFDIADRSASRFRALQARRHPAFSALTFEQADVLERIPGTQGPAVYLFDMDAGRDKTSYVVALDKLLAVGERDLVIFHDCLVDHFEPVFTTLDSRLADHGRAPLTRLPLDEFGLAMVRL